MLDDPELARALAVRAIQGQLLRLKWLAAATRFELAMRRHDRALRRAVKANFNPNQPRVPRGQDGAGEWTDGESDSSSRIQTAQAGFEQGSTVLSKEKVKIYSVARQSSNEPKPDE